MNRHMSILVIEDDEILSATLAAAFRADGYEVFLAATGAAGCDLARTNRPRAVLLDLGLPDRDGLEVAGELRREILPAESLIIVLTGRRISDTKLADSAGVDLVLHKPVEPHLLGGLVDFVDRRRSRGRQSGGPLA